MYYTDCKNSNPTYLVGLKVRHSVLLSSCDSDSRLLVYMYGGVRRGSGPIFRLFFPTCDVANFLFVDIAKAVCIGAKVVGMGCPFLYAQSVRVNSFYSNGHPCLCVNRHTGTKA